MGEWRSEGKRYIGAYLDSKPRCLDKPGRISRLRAYDVQVPEMPVSGRVIGAEPKPRALVVWNGADIDEIEHAISPHAPTIRHVGNLMNVRQRDYDVLITNNLRFLLGDYGRRPDPHLCIIWFASELANEYDEWSTPTYKVKVKRSDGYRSQSLVIPDELPAGIADLVRDHLAPSRLTRNVHQTFILEASLTQKAMLAEAVRAQAGERVERAPVPQLLPFLSSPDQMTLAGAYPRSPCSEGWVLPLGTLRPAEWIIAALKHWSIKYRTFPLVGSWWEEPDWQTSAEIDASKRLNAARAKLAKVAGELEQEIETALAQLEVAQREAANGRRHLLESKGTHLESTVGEAFVSLGYSVKFLDMELRSSGRGEDLTVVDPDDTSLDPIVEIKGYDQGAKAGDLSKIMRHLIRARDEGRNPSAVWWVVNHWRAKPPADRERLFVSEEPMVDEQANADPPLVLIDSRSLFRAVGLVEDGKVRSADVRRSLREARGRWSAPS